MMSALAAFLRRFRSEPSTGSSMQREVSALDDLAQLRLHVRTREITYQEAVERLTVLGRRALEEMESRVVAIGGACAAISELAR